MNNLLKTNEFKGEYKYCKEDSDCRYGKCDISKLICICDKDKICSWSENHIKEAQNIVADTMSTLHNINRCHQYDISSKCVWLLTENPELIDDRAIKYGLTVLGSDICDPIKRESAHLAIDSVSNIYQASNRISG